MTMTLTEIYELNGSMNFKLPILETIQPNSYLFIILIFNPCYPYSSTWFQDELKSEVCKLAFMKHSWSKIVDTKSNSTNVWLDLIYKAMKFI